MVKKKMFKVFSIVEKHGGGSYWMRLGTGFTNKDDSINLYLDALPTNGQLQLREMTEEDFAKKSDRAPAHPLGGSPAQPADALPF